MYAGFIHWYAVVAPLWLVSLFLNMQKGLWQYFSVPLMIRTLFAHWHKDAVGYKGDIPSRLQAFAWNQISRGIGFLIRVSVLAIWIVAEAAFVAFAIFFFSLFMLWPGLILAGFFTFLAMLI